MPSAARREKKRIAIAKAKRAQEETMEAETRREEETANYRCVDLPPVPRFPDLSQPSDF